MLFLEILALTVFLIGWLDIPIGLYSLDVQRVGVFALAGLFLTNRLNTLTRGLELFSNALYKKPKLRFIIFFLWSAAWGLLALLKHWGLHTGDFDVGIFSQVLDSIAKGNGYLQTVDVSSNYLNIHQNFTLPIFAPLFWTPWGAELLLFFQPFFLFSPALIIYRWILEPPQTFTYKVAAAGFFAWLIAPPVLWNTIWEWHETSLSVILFCLWTICYLQRRWIPFFVCAMLLGLTKEYYLITILPGLWLAALSAPTRNVKLGALFMSIVFIAVFIFERKYLVHLDYTNERYSHLGNTPTQVLLSVFYDPLKWMALLASPERLDFIKNLIFYAGGAFLLVPRTYALWAPALVFHLLSNRQAQYLPNYHYVLEIFPILLVISLFYLKRSPPWMLTAFLVLILIQPGPYYLTHFNNYLKDSRANAPIMREIKAQIADLSKECKNGVAGVSSKWTFSHLFQLGQVYPHVHADSLHKKPGFDSELAKKAGEGCFFIVGQASENNDLKNSLGLGTSPIEIKSWKISDFTTSDDRMIVYERF